MEPDFDYNTVPNNYIHCFHTECPHAAKCLRYQVALFVPPEQHIITIVSPLFKVPAGQECRYFRPDEMKNFALGMKQMLNELPYNESVIIKQQMIAYFKRTTFYRCQKQERLIKPEEQEYIRQIFLSRGITEPPAFDSYIRQYDW